MNSEPEGILLVDKPQGITSHDVVDCIRRLYQTRRVGHAGTLDPMATGLLIILVGKATKASQYLMSQEKTYEGEATLGITTNSQDADGEMVETRPVPELAAETIQGRMNTLLGDQYQTPPMHSARKVGGKKLYELARKGIEIERAPRFIRVETFKLLQWQSPKASFTVHCTKGTYVRTLAYDLGEKLGCGAHLSALRRTSSGSLQITQAYTLEKLGSLTPEALVGCLIPVHQAVPSIALG
jgi:tRNA pseudouridine55 synthase